MTPTRTQLDVHDISVDIDRTELRRFLGRIRRIRRTKPVLIEDPTNVRLNIRIGDTVWQCWMSVPGDDDIILTGSNVNESTNICEYALVRTNHFQPFTVVQKIVMFDEDTDDRDHYSKPWLDTVRRLLS